MEKEKTKAFDVRLFEENDPAARLAVKKYYRKLGLLIEDNEDIYGQDLVVKYHVEIERRPGWTGPQFPFQTVHIPFRKVKFMHSFCIYMVTNRECSHALQTDIRDVPKFPLREVGNKYVRMGERFYDVPLSVFSLVCL